MNTSRCCPLHVEVELRYRGQSGPMRGREVDLAAHKQCLHRVWQDIQNCNKANTIKSSVVRESKQRCSRGDMIIMIDLKYAKVIFSLLQINRANVGNWSARVPIE